MKRSLAAYLLALLAVASIPRPPAAAAMEVAVSVSPAEGLVGHQIEVLLRTAPFDEGVVRCRSPTLPYPAASGIRNILFPFPDYPFDVVARAEDGTTIAVPLARDPNDATLWRGTFSPTKSGVWTIAVRTYPAGHPGTSAQASVAAGEIDPFMVFVGAAALSIGVAVGLFLGRRQRNRDATPPS